MRARLNTDDKLLLALATAIFRVYKTTVCAMAQKSLTVSPAPAISDSKRNHSSSAAAAVPSSTTASSKPSNASTAAAPTSASQTFGSAEALATFRAQLKPFAVSLIPSILEDIRLFDRAELAKQI
jgi:hypothetical protein